MTVVNLAEAQSPLVNLALVKDSVGNYYGEVIVINIVNNTGKHLYLPYVSFEGNLILKERGKAKNFSWCYYNKKECYDQYLRSDYGVYRTKADSILKKNGLEKFALSLRV